VTSSPSREVRQQACDLDPSARGSRSIRAVFRRMGLSVSPSPRPYAVVWRNMLSRRLPNVTRSAPISGPLPLSLGISDHFCFHAINYEFCAADESLPNETSHSLCLLGRRHPIVFLHGSAIVKLKSQDRRLFEHSLAAMSLYQ
jgi:hypothetical protein